ncbi:MAG: dhaA 2 [Thermoleophilia bacterium]|nr:dhaA 2 [Thermoleophilia bacterium]
MSPRVYLLHGLGADRRAFQRFERLLPTDWHVESIDLLGHGDAPKPDAGYALDHHAAYVAGVVEAHAPVVLVGHSYGAATSVAVAATRPELVAGLVLLDPIVHFAGGDGAGATAQMMRARREGTLAQVVPALFEASSPALQQWTIDTWQRMHLGVVDEMDNAWTRFADRVTCPVAIVHGELELGGGGDLASDWFDDPVDVNIAGAGHYLHATHAREVADEVIAAVTRFSA